MKDPASPDQGNILAQTDADRTDYRFPVCVYDGLSAKDVDITVKFKPVSGKGDQGAGIVWRYQNKDNYYIVRANALEGNVVLYKVENGRRTDLPLVGKGGTYGMKERGLRENGAHCAWSPREISLRSITTTRNFMKLKTRHSRRPARWAYGPRPTR